jgi:hypothetical protein
MSNKYKVLGVFITAFLYGCTGNSGSSKTEIDSTLKRFSGVVNNSSVKGIDVGALRIDKHGQFALGETGEVEALNNTSDENGRFGFSVDVNNIGPYILTVIAPEFESDTEAEKAAKMSCQVVPSCSVNGKVVPFGDYYSVESKSQWSAAVQSIENGQFIVINPITEMAKALGYTAYINDGSLADDDLDNATKPSANYYSNYNIAKSNSQTASLLGLGEILSKEPANLALLHDLNINASTSIEESIRYGALLAAWQQLELEYNNNILEGDLTFQQQAIKEYLLNQGQLYQAAALENQVLSLSDWYEAAYLNLEKVRDYHKALNRSVPSEINLVIQRFKTEIGTLDLKPGLLTEAKPTIPDYYVEDYTDAVMKTKAMVNYIINLKDNFATSEYRDSIKSSSDLVLEQNRLLAPKLDIILDKILSIKKYYLSCAHGSCDVMSDWHGNGNSFDESTSILTIVQDENTSLILSQARVYDDRNPEDSDETNVHDLYFQGTFESDGLRLELSDFASGESTAIKSSLRFSFAKKLSQIPQQPNAVNPGMGVTVDEDLVPDYIELSLPNFKLYSPVDKDTAGEVQVFGSLTALMVANVDAGDSLKSEEERLGKRYNLSSVKASVRLSGQPLGSSGEEELRDNAIFFIDATASESFISSLNPVAYFPDTKYPKFDAFFKPREGFSKGTISPYPLSVSRKGVMEFPRLDVNGDFSTDINDVVNVDYIELDYEVGGLERYVVYPKVEGEYWGLVCTALPDNEADLEAAAPGYTKPVVDEEGNPVLDEEGNQYQQALLVCPSRDKYEGDATPDDFVNKIYTINKDLFNLRGYNGQGSYRIDYPVTGEKLDPFPTQETSYSGVLEQPIVLGVDSMRLQFKPNLVNSAGSGYLEDSILDISLVWRTQDIIDINAFLAFDTERVINNPNGSGIPYLAVGSDSESYSISYRTDAEGTESGEYVMAWAGVHFVDGAPGTQVMQKTDNEELKEGVFAGIGSNVSYTQDSDVTDKKCGIFGRGNEPTAGEKCDSIAYFTFRGLVTGSLREERDGVYVIRYIDGSWQILGE